MMQLILAIVSSQDFPCNMRTNYGKQIASSLFDYTGSMFMDVRYINPFLEGTLEVLKKLTGVEPVAGRPYTKVDNTACGDVSGIIGIMGNAIGSLAISFKESCILAITSQVLGESYEDICRDVFDTVGELTNMISGVARNKMEKEGLKAYAAIPTVIYGKNHVIMHILKSPSIVIPFDTPYGQFFVDVCIKVVEDAQVGVSLNSGFLKEVYKPRPIEVASEEGPKGKAKHGGPAAAAKPLTPEEKIALAREKLEKLVAQRDETMRLLKDNPFMEFKRRQALKKLLPVYEDKIKQLKLDIQALEALMKIDPADEPEIKPHFQNYPK